MDNTNLEERLIAQAKKAAELIKDELSILQYGKLCSTIIMCENYVQGVDGLSWDDVYEEIYREEENDEDCGVYILSQFIDIPDEVELFLALPIEILAYVCWLGCKAQNDYFPSDLSPIIGDKIPDFVSFLEENLTSKEDFQKAMDFANKKCVINF